MIIEDIYNDLENGYFQFVAGNQMDRNLLQMDIAEIRYCDRIRMPALFVLKGNKRIFPGSPLAYFHSHSFKQNPLLRVIEWAKAWVKGDDNRIVIVRSAYIGGYMLE